MVIRKRRKPQHKDKWEEIKIALDENRDELKTRLVDLPKEEQILYHEYLVAGFFSQEEYSDAHQAAENLLKMDKENKVGLIAEMAWFSLEKNTKKAANIFWKLDELKTEDLYGMVWNIPSLSNLREYLVEKKKKKFNMGLAIELLKPRAND